VTKEPILASSNCPCKTLCVLYAQANSIIETLQKLSVSSFQKASHDPSLQEWIDHLSAISYQNCSVLKFEPDACLIAQPPLADDQSLKMSADEDNVAVVVEEEVSITVVSESVAPTARTRGPSLAGFWFVSVLFGILGVVLFWLPGYSCPDLSKLK
jgi:hypothetical protein